MLRPCLSASRVGGGPFEIAKALGQDARILIMDEPTSSLTAGESEKLFGIIRQLRSEGIGIIYFDDKDVVRHKLVQQIVKAYDAYSTPRAKDQAS